MICPNTNDPAWKSLEKSIGKRETYRVWLQNGKMLPNVGNLSLKNHSKLIDQFTADFNTETIVNTNMGVSGRVIGNKNGKVIVEINPNLISDDTIIHEYGHIYIDLLGGLENSRVKAGIRQLKGTPLEAEINNKYSDKDEAYRAKELLVTAMGREGVKVFNDLQNEQLKSFKVWLVGVFNEIGKLLGIQPNIARQLASEMIKRNLQKDMQGSVSLESEYEQRVEENKDKELTSLEKIALKAEAVIKRKIIVLGKDIKNKSDAKQQNFAELEILLDDLKNKSEEVSLLSYVNTAVGHSQAALKQLSKDKDMSLSDLMFLKGYIDAYDIETLKDIRDAFENLNTKGGKSLAISSINNVISIKDQINDLYKKRRNTILTPLLAKGYDKIEAIYARNALLEFTNPNNLKGTERKEAIIEFTNNYLKINRDKITKETQDEVTNMFKLIPKDIGDIDFRITNAKDLNSEIIRYVTGRLDEINYITGGEVASIAKRLHVVLNAFKAKVGTTADQAKQYSLFLQKDAVGKLTGNLIHPDSEEGLALLDGKHGKEAADLYDFFILMIQRKDEYVGNAFRLGVKLPYVEKTALEKAAANGIVKAFKEEFGDLWKVRNTDTEAGEVTETPTASMTKMTDLIEATTDIHGREKQYIPIQYRRKLDPKDMSFDLSTLLLLDYAQSLNYANMRGFALEAEAIKEVVAETKFGTQQGLLNRVFKGTTDPVTIAGDKSNTYAVIDAIIQHRIYGIHMTGDPKIAKLVKTLKSYTNHVQLLGNLQSIGANYLQGHTMGIIESGGQFYGLTDVLAGKTKVAKDFLNVKRDIGNYIKTSKSFLLLEVHDTETRNNFKHTDYAKSTVARRAVSMDTLYSPNQWAEKNPKIHQMYYVLNALKAMDDKGNYITKDGKVTKDRKEAMSADEAYSHLFINAVTGKGITQEEFDKLSTSEQDKYSNASLKLDQKVKFFEQPNGSTLTPGYETSRYVERIGRNSFGNYSSEDVAIAQRHWLGSLAYQNRRWMVGGFKARFKGHLLMADPSRKKLGFRLIKREELANQDLNYNPETKSFEEGSYITTMRFIAAHRKALISFKASILSENWHKLTDMEKGNIRRTAIEGAIIGITIISAAMFAGVDDDDDDLVLYGAFYTKRLKAELLTYVNPKDAIATLRSPTATLSLIENVVKALYQLGDPGELYKSGVHKGESKLKIKTIFKLTPLKSVDRDFSEAIKVLDMKYN